MIADEYEFQRPPLGYGAFSKLRDHVDELRWTPSDGGDRSCEHALFARSGCKPSVRDAAEERDDLRLFAVEGIVEALRS